MGLKWYEKVAATAFAGAAAVYALDCWHVYSVIAERKRSEDEFDSEKEKQLMKNIIERYAGENAKKFAVDSKTFQERLVKEEELRKQKHSGRSEETIALSNFVQRESLLFLAGGRAALLQLGHPYVAAGIAEHSNLKNGVQERFYRTFKYMFAMIFGEVDESVRASRVVRSLHSKVKGTIKEDVGIFTKDSTFDASHSHALFWVHLTLFDSAVFMYEVGIRRLTQEEKLNFIQITNQFATGMFGVPEELLASSWEESLGIYNAMVNSPVIEASETAKEIDSFLWKPPSPRFWPLLALVRWQTFVMMPKKLARSFYGRDQTNMDLFFWVLIMAQVRFIYRLLPESVRFLSAFLSLENRLGVKRSRVENVLAKWSATVANFFLGSIMPPRDVESTQAPPSAGQQQ